MKKDSFDSVFENVERVSVVMPHPDDAELYCGGTIARLASKGVAIQLIKMSNGGKGTKQSSISEEELGKARSREDYRAVEKLGVSVDQNIQLNLPDGEIENNYDTIGKIAFHFRQFRPDLVITCNPEDVIIRFGKGANWVNHRDHRNTAKTAIDAAYPYSRDTAFFPDQFENLKSEFSPTTLFLLADYYNHQDVVYIEISDFIAQKRAAWECHESAYTKEAVVDAIEYLNQDGNKYFETFRFVISD